VRIRGERGYLTIKGMSRDGGLSRYEWEKEIPLAEARELMELCEPGVIDKTRYLIDAGDGLTWEVDEFYGDNQGLVMAEIELPAADAPFARPAWLGREVTSDRRYYNSSLTKLPFTQWTDN
jgi:CYTH domain-containing protein